MDEAGQKVNIVLSHTLKAKTVNARMTFPPAYLTFSYLCFMNRGTKITSVLACRAAERDRERLQHWTVVFCKAKLALDCKSLAKALFNSENSFASSSRAALTCGVSRRSNVMVRGGGMFAATGGT